jgi:DNA-directed RNA polymerase beta subunit
MVPIFFTLLAQDNYISVSDILNYTQSKPFSPAFGNTLLAAGSFVVNGILSFSSYNLFCAIIFFIKVICPKW